MAALLATLVLAFAGSSDRPLGDRALLAPPTHIEPMLRIEWSRGPDLPQGFQDSDGGFLGSTLVTVGGFCSGGLPEDNQRKPGRYPRGFLRKAWSLDVAAASPRWQTLPDLPGVERQGLFTAVVGNSLCLWGGFNYSKPFCYRDGWRLTQSAARKSGTPWNWEPLPPLPSELTSSALCAIDGHIYAVGGADYDNERFYTQADRSGRRQRLGARLMRINLAKPNTGWQQLAECPGTPRFVHTVQAVGGKIYVIGGATGDFIQNGTNFGYCTVVDNWMFDPSSQRWSRMRDLPVSSGNFPKSSNLVYGDRYIILPGGYQYPKVANPNGTIRDKYGAASQKRPASGLHNDVFVYDTRTDRFGTADKLPIDNNLPMAVVRGDRLYLIGGETGGGFVEGEYYGHHPDLLLIGAITKVK